MNKETRTLFAVLAVSIIVIWFARPKGMKANKSHSNDKYSAPQESSVDSVKLKEDAVIAMQAMKDAIAKNEPKSELDKLKAIIYKDYGIKIMIHTRTKKLRAMSKSGALIAEEA